MKTHSVEILDPESGLFVSLTNGGSGAIMIGDDVIAAAPIPENGLDRLDDGPLSLETDRGTLEVEIASAGEPIVFDGELTGRHEARLAGMTGTLVDQGQTIELDCSGVLHSRDGAENSTELTRDLTIILADGGLICVASAAPPGTRKHSEEEAVSAVSHPRGYIEFEEVLLSTEYDGAGRQIRATLELWPASDEIAVLHGAGSVISGCTANVGDRQINTALFRWSLDGHLGLGRYEISAARDQAG
ncbi:MAG: hypothetical protein IPK93_09215 [Solirubrobacterales bacterium]|nr:hypothetical protein [Solirubrobacterales bacterium]